MAYRICQRPQQEHENGEHRLGVVPDPVAEHVRLDRLDVRRTQTRARA